MKTLRLKVIPIVILLLIAGGGLAYTQRGWIRNVWWEWKQSRLPPAEPHRPQGAQDGQTVGGEDGVSAFEPGYSTSENYVIETAPKTPQKPKATLNSDPLAWTGALPTEANLDVPFTMQAPHSNWAMPWQEMCEEASMLMVDRFYKGQTGKLDKDDANEEMLKIVDYENKVLGFYQDTTAAETAKIVSGFYGYERVLIRPLTGPDDIKKAVALGYPVIVPAAGKLLKNPYFRNGGPVYHMLVVRGYTDKNFITNDPGVGRGYGYTYSYETFMNAAHDWNDGNVTEGKKVMIVVLPKE